MKWLMRLLGRTHEELPPHVQEAMDTGARASEAIAEARDAADSYWQTRRESARAAEQRVIEGYRQAERRRRD